MDFGLDIFISDPFFYIYRRLRKVRKRLSFTHEKTDRIPDREKFLAEDIQKDRRS